jgi:hypothetical protein
LAYNNNNNNNVLKMNLTETGHAVVNCLVQDRVYWRLPVNTALNLWGPNKMENFSTTRRITNSHDGSTELVTFISTSPELLVLKRLTYPDRCSSLFYLNLPERFGKDNILKLESNIHRNSITAKNTLRLHYKGKLIEVVYSEIHTKTIYTSCGKNYICNVKVGDIYFEN